MSDLFGVETIDAGWKQVLAAVKPQLATLEAKISSRIAAGEVVLPAEKDVLRCFRYPFAEVKVLIIGQDPYPTLGNAVGLSFSVAATAKLPASLRNIFTELISDLKINASEDNTDTLFAGFENSTKLPTETVTANNLRSPDLSDWAAQGVCLLNRVLTVAEGNPGAHQNLGWEEITNQAVRALVSRESPLVVILWGAHAQQVRKLIPARENILVIESAHPSPLSARKGFFGSKPFSRANQHLSVQGVTPIKWV
ncbi:uracil-DNA glycosylase [Gleimia sp. 6138-11-ORH1]|uniref:uracil-DNA glycosylase n=1 Tax=Gleimia sp. 6138-11-ORH1 TaxID=2973937 RepID=UPI00216A7AF0|nr:uracil-DNA glycosylase [Gleimia sp. 6138-11-ORH1]MCS4484769.1 uracil-DNA glycosylase [Gleimia sp. 6138-11-ORH1]